jgi:hypothetical protein
MNLRSRDGRLLGLSVGSLGSGTGGGADDVDVDLVALLVLDGGLIEVVEVAAQALLEDGGTTKGKRAVGASRPASSVLGTSLGGRAIELELAVGDNGTNALLGVSQDTILEGDLKRCGVALLPLL